MLKFNMGCGHNRKPGYVNVDSAAESAADEVFDLDTTPWPWADSCADEIHFIHSLEHMGADAKVFLAIMQEIYRIAADGALIRIHAPHPRHDTFIGDPTHVRPITPDMLRLFDLRQNEGWRRDGRPNTPLALYLGVDFTDMKVAMVLDEPYGSRHREGRSTQAEINEAVRTLNNVVVEYQITLTVRKPPPEAA